MFKDFVSYIKNYFKKPFLDRLHERYSKVLVYRGVFDIDEVKLIDLLAEYSNLGSDPWFNTRPSKSELRRLAQQGGLNFLIHNPDGMTNTKLGKITQELLDSTINNIPDNLTHTVGMGLGFSICISKGLQYGIPFTLVFNPVRLNTEHFYLYTTNK